MSELFRDTVFGHAVRFISNGRFFQFPEEMDASLWKPYIDPQQTKTMALYGNPSDQPPEDKHKHESAPVSESHSYANFNANGANLSEESSQTRTGDGEQQVSSTITGQRIDPEKGRDGTTVTWFGDNDPEVGIFWDDIEDGLGAKPATDANELVNFQKSLCYLPNLPPDLLSLHWLRHLQCRNGNRGHGFWRFTNKGHSWSDPLRCWLWSWTNDLGPLERNTADRKKPHLHWNTGSLRHFPGTNGVGGELCHAVVLSLLDRFHR